MLVYGSWDLNCLAGGVSTKKGALIHHGKSSSKLNLDIWQNTSSDLFGQAKSYVPHMDLFLLSSIVSKTWTTNS